MPEANESPIVQALRRLAGGGGLFPSAPPPSQPATAPYLPPAASWAEVQSDPLKALANLVMGAVDPWGQPKGMNTGSIGGMLGAALPLVGATKALTAGRAAEEGVQGIRVFHGSPHDFPPVNLIELQDGTRLYHNLRELPQMPTGAKVIKEFPLGRFDMSKIGTGEGAQAYGHGLYFADAEKTAKFYRDALQDGNLANPERMAKAAADAVGGPMSDGSVLFKGRLWSPTEWVEAFKSGRLTGHDFGPQARTAIEKSLQGRIYEVNLSVNPDHLLDWDTPLSQQSQYVQDAAKRLGGWTKEPGPFGRDFTGGDFVRGESEFTEPAHISKTLKDAGIPGIKYLDGGSRAAGEGSRNYVIFDDSLVTILKKYGVALPMIEALRRKAQRYGGRVPADDVHRAIQS